MNQPVHQPTREFTDAKRQITEIYDSLMNDPGDIANCPESLFVKMFLPFFSGHRVIEDEGMPARWIAIAGNPFKPVNVFNDKTMEILYQVPAFFDMEAVVVSNRKHGSLGDIIQRASQLSQIHPSQGVNHFAKSVQKLELLQDRSAEVARTKAIWFEIFKRYNIQPIGWDAPAQTTESKPKSEVDQVDFDDGENL
jgi:hypothetical protein